MARDEKELQRLTPTLQFQHGCNSVEQPCLLRSYTPMQAPLRASGAGLTPSLHRPNLLFLSSHAYRHPPKCHATEPKSTLSAHTNATYTDKRTDIEELPTSLFTVASQEFPRRFFHATHEGRSAAPAHTATSAYKPAHNHSCSPRLSPTQCCRNQLPNSTIKCRHYMMDCSSKPRITQVELRALYRPIILHCLKTPHCG